MTLLLYLYLSLLSFPCLSVAQIGPSTSSGGTSPTSSTSSASSLSSPSSPSIGWSIPISGLEDDPEKPWGVNVSSSTSGPGYKLFPLAIGSNTTISTDGSSSSSHASFPFAVNSNEDGAGLWMIPGPDGDLPLNVNSSVGYGAESHDGYVLPTAPFCLNLGRKGLWNGSITFGLDYYDRNRALGPQDSYIHLLLPFEPILEANFKSNGTFLATGKQKVYDAKMAVLNRFSESSTAEYEVNVTVGDAVLDFNSEYITLPRQEWCGKNVSFTFRYGRDYIRIPSYLTESNHRCKGPDSKNLIENPLILGKPFFQVVNVLVFANADMWIIPANTWNLPPQPMFMVDIQNVEYPDDPSLSTPAPEPKKNVGAIVGGTIGGVAGLVLIGAALFFLRRRYGQKPPPPYSASKDSNNIALT